MALDEESRGEIIGYCDPAWAGDDGPRGSVVQLPHSCDSWVIGGVEEIRALISDLEELLGRLE